jgi:magnesium chelatase subunit D
VDTHSPQSTRDGMRQEVLALGRQLGSLDRFDFVCIDTEDPFVGTGMARELARVAQGTYYPLPKATTSSVARITQAALREASLSSSK